MKGAIREGHPLSKLWEKFLNRLYEVVTDRETNLEAFLMKDIDEISVSQSDYVIIMKMNAAFFNDFLNPIFKG